MDVFLSITAFLCCLVGIVGCIVPVLPGPVLSYAGLFCAYACSYSTLTPAEMWLWAGLTAAVTAADYFLPGYMAKLFGGTRAGMVGATVGMIAGVFGSNLTYRTPELLSRPWFHEVDVSKYIAYFIAALNHDLSVSAIIDPHEKIKALLERTGQAR